MVIAIMEAQVKGKLNSKCVETVFPISIIRGIAPVQIRTQFIIHLISQSFYLITVHFSALCLSVLILWSKEDILRTGVKYLVVTVRM
ncbi:hypothetical protein CHQ57_17615 [Aeromonas salmonicida]|nr:hypothetical protein CHQ57_17615 [Aeromonas salmonicida]